MDIPAEDKPEADSLDSRASEPNKLSLDTHSLDDKLCCGCGCDYDCDCDCDCGRGRDPALWNEIAIAMSFVDHGFDFDCGYDSRCALANDARKSIPMLHIKSLLRSGESDFADCECKAVLFARCRLQNVIVVLLLRKSDEAKTAGYLCSFFKADERFLDLSLCVIQSKFNYEFLEIVFQIGVLPIFWNAVYVDFALLLRRFLFYRCLQVRIARFRSVLRRKLVLQLCWFSLLFNI